MMSHYDSSFVLPVWLYTDEATHFTTGVSVFTENLKIQSLIYASFPCKKQVPCPQCFQLTMNLLILPLPL